ncbi:hypothetical protein [Pseudonocardia sp. McavD-2-B]|uniref:DUF6907 domain-containing protein n=1 Tax=Pseudonocardia sp. McavD-2-B TaxID=2954499 RepID=UPI00209754F9|nr:hypothetical protein [Pseudonocardia sp. McavD-2-B]MCO7196627.1 hypothetical protein [Pseudonocardia sp. McavD-2-B]
MSKLATLHVPTPRHDHIEWCRAHEDAGQYDQVCQSEGAELRPVSGTTDDPGTVTVSAVQTSDRYPASRAWDVQPAQVVIGIGRIDAYVDTALTPAEARQVAADLLAAADLAEHHTGRCER